MLFKLLKWSVTMSNALYCWLVAISLIIVAYLLIHFVVVENTPSVIKQIFCFGGMMYVLLLVGVSLMRLRYVEYSDNSD